MGRIKPRKRKLPITAAPAPTPSQTTRTTREVGSSGSVPIQRHNSSTSSSARALIRRFHVLHKKRDQLQKQLELSNHTAKARAKCNNELSTVEEEINALGGLERYQAMSSLGQAPNRGGSSAKRLVFWIKNLLEDENFDIEGQRRFRLLDVGAVEPDNYATTNFIEATPIDLHSRHPGIIEQDFMLIGSATNANPNVQSTLKPESSSLQGPWDVISLSLVLNFVPDPRGRGEMLRKAHALLKPGGLLFIVLPLPCLLNSRYTNVTYFTSLMSHLGFEKLKEEWKESGKVGYWLFRRDSKIGTSIKGERATGESGNASGNKTLDFSQKRVILEGPKRNNFSILL
ncbi:hypothetical protein CPB86DRAFT_871557 [Serendipita vermifera]|nr:hypothetical protein CPB86DRAFT_871557 [Serendipita vermifera]